MSASMTAVEAVARLQEEMISASDIKACHEKAVELCMATLKNKERPISAVQLFWFGATGDTFPFTIDSELKMNNRMPFFKMKERFPHPLFTQLPCLSRGEAAHRGDMRVGYCEVRGCDDVNQNVVKTADYLSANKWIGIINASEGAKIYLMPTCSVSHDLGVTQANYPQMLHAVFVKKNRESRSSRLSSSSSAAERLRKELSPGDSSKQEEVGGAVGGALKRRVSFAPIPTTTSGASSSSPLDGGAQRVKIALHSPSYETIHDEDESRQQDLTANRTKDAYTTEEDEETQKFKETHHQSSTYSAHTPSPGPSELVKERDVYSPPVSEPSEAGSVASSLSSSSPSLPDYQQVTGRGRGKRGRGRGRGKRGGRGRGGTVVADVGEMIRGQESGEELVGRGRGSRGRKRRGRGTRGTRGRGRGRGGASNAATEGEYGDVSLVPEPKRARLSVDMVTVEERSARANNSVLYDLLDSQATSITPLQQVQIQMCPILPRGSVTRQPSTQQQPTSQLPTIPGGDKEEKEVTRGDGASGSPTETTSPSVTMAIETVSREDDHLESESVSQGIFEEADTREPEVQVQEEVVSALHGDQEAVNQMDVDSGPYFQPPKPPRRVSLLEYKERMKGRRKHSTEETPRQHEGADMEGQKVEDETVLQSTQGDAGASETVPGVEREQESDTRQKETRVDQLDSEAVAEDSSAMAGRVLQQSAVHLQQEGHQEVEKMEETSKELSEEPVPSTEGKVATKAVEQPPPSKVVEVIRKVAEASSKASTSPSKVVEVIRKVAEASSKASTSPSKVVEVIRKVAEASSKASNSSSKVVEVIREVAEASSKASASPSKVAVELRSQTASEVVEPLSKVAASPCSVAESSQAVEGPQGEDEDGSIEWPDEERRSCLVSDEGARDAHTAVEHKSVEKEDAGSEKETGRGVELGESSRDRGKQETDEERERQLSGGKEKKQGEAEREQEKEKKKEWANKMEELDKDWRTKREKEKRLSRKIGKPVESRKPPTSIGEQIPTHSSPFVPPQKRFGIRQRARYPLAIPPQVIPPHQPTPTQPFLGYAPHPPHPFHQPPAPAFPPPPHPPPPPLQQADVWSMFGSLFAQHNLFPAEDTPMPPQRTPSPLRPPAMHFGSPGRSPSPPRRAPSPDLGSPHGRKSRSPEPVSSSPMTPSLSNPSANPKPLDAKQFKIISELIKQTTVKKCDASVQIVPPRMISEGTQDGRGFRLKSRAVQVRIKTQESSTNTDANRPEFHHRYAQTSAIPTRNTYIQTQPAVKTVGTQTTCDDATANSLAAALETFESVLGTVGCTYPAIDAIVTRVEDWLSRQASLSTDTGSTSDYEPADMSCEENDEKGEEGDGVFVSPKAAAVPSPVVSGASNISEGDLSDIVSPSPDKTLTTEMEDDDRNHLYSPSHPLESGEEEESHLPSPPPVPPQSLLVPSTTPSLAPSLSHSGVLTDRPLWPAVSFDESQHTKSEEKGLEKHGGLGEDKHNTSDEKTDNEEAFADQMLEEQFSQCSGGSKRSSSHPFAVQLVPDDGGQVEHKASSEGADAQRGEKRVQETETNEKAEAVTISMDYSERSLTAKEPSQTEEEEDAVETAAGQQNTARCEDLKGSATKYENPRTDDLTLPSPSSLLATEEGTKPDTAASHSSSSSSPRRRSARQRERSEKGQVTSGPVIRTRHKSKFDTSSKDSDESQSSSSYSRGRHKYETRHRRRSEPDEDESSSGREERRELRSRHKRHSENDSSSEMSDRRELKPRKGADKKEDRTDEGEYKKSRSRKSKDEKPAKSQRDRSPLGKRREKAQSKLMVPTLQAFEDESNNSESAAEFSEKIGSPTVQRESVARFESASPSKQQSEKKRACEDEASGDKERETKDEECYLRSLSLPPFKVAKTSPAGSPTERALSGCDSHTLSPRSISHSPPGSAVVKKKRPVLTKDELLAMVRAKKKIGLTKSSPPSEHSSESENGASGERVGETTGQSRLDMKKLMFNFHKHMQARKGSDTSWIHPWDVSTDGGSNPPRGAVVPIPHGSTYSLKNPPPPPPGPPPSANVQSARLISTNPQQQMPLPTLVEGDIDGTAESAELQATEETLLAVFQDAVDRVVEERIQSEEIFQGRFLDTVEDKIVQESVRKIVDTAVEEKVTELICAEEVLQERTLEAVEDSLSGEIVRFALEEGVGGKVVELIRAENVLQERVLDTIESKIVHETVAKLTDEEITKESKWLVQSEEILQEEAIKSMQKTVISEMVRRAVGEEINKKVRETVKSEEFLQERAVSVVESQVVEQTVAEALRKAAQEQVLVRIQTELVEETAGAVEEVLMREFEASVAKESTLEGEASNLVMVEVLKWVMEESVVVVARESVGATETMVDAVVRCVEQETSEQLVCECEGSLAAEAATEEILDKVAATVEGDLLTLATERVAKEAASEEIILEMVGLVSEELQCDFMDEVQSKVALELAQIEEQKQDTLVENCLQVIEDGLLQENLLFFSTQLITQALNELEEKAIKNAEEQVLQDILQSLVDDIIAFDLELQAAEKLLEAVFSDVLGEVVVEVVDNEERVAAFMQGIVTSLVVEETLKRTENSVAEEQANKEDDIAVKVEEEISQTVVTELVETTQGGVAAKITEESIAEEIEDQAIDSFISLLLAHLVKEIASERVESQEATVLDVGEVASKRAEIECAREAEDVVVKELAVEGEVQEVTMSEILDEIEEKAGREEVLGEVVADELEKGIMDGIEGEAASQTAEDVVKSSVTYEVTEVFPDTPDNTQTTTPTHVHIMEAGPVDDNQIIYEVTEVVPDSVTQLKAQKTLVHIHMDSDELTEGKTGSDLLSESSDEQVSTYVHFIDTPQQGDEVKDTTESQEEQEDTSPAGAALSPSEVKPIPDTPEKNSQSEDCPMSPSSSVASFSPPPLAVLNPLLPKYISRRLQLHPFGYFPPPEGVQRPTPLPLASSSSSQSDTPPSEQVVEQDGEDITSLRLASPRRRIARRGWRSRSGRSGARRRSSSGARRRSSSGYRQPTATERELRPRTRSQSCSSSANTSSDPPITPFTVLSPTTLTHQALSLIHITDQYATSSTPPPTESTTPRPRGRRGRPPKSKGRCHSGTPLARRGARSSRKTSKEASRPSPRRSEMSLILCLPRSIVKKSSPPTSQKESTILKRETESVTEVSSFREVAEGVKKGNQENNDVFMDVDISQPQEDIELCGPQKLSHVESNVKSELPANTEDSHCSKDMEPKEIASKEGSFESSPESGTQERTVPTDDKDTEANKEVGVTLANPKEKPPVSEDPMGHLGTETIAPLKELVEPHKEEDSVLSVDSCKPQEESGVGCGAGAGAQGEDNEEWSQVGVKHNLILQIEAMAKVNAASEDNTIEMLSEDSTSVLEGSTSEENESLIEDEANVCPGPTTQCLTEESYTRLRSEDETYASEGCTSKSLTEDSAEESCTSPTTEASSLTEDKDKVTDSEGYTTHEDDRENTPDLPSTFSVDLYSPQASPATGVSFSPTTTTSPLSISDEDMILRLEASFSSAPETDSDPEGDLELATMNETRAENVSQPDGSKCEPSSLDESESKADRDTEGLATEWGASIGDSGTTEDAVAGHAETSKISVSIANATASLGHCEQGKPPENDVPQPPEPTLVSEDDVIDSLFDDSETETDSSEIISESDLPLSDVSPSVSPSSPLPYSDLLGEGQTANLSLPSLPSPSPPPPPPPVLGNFDDSRPPWATAKTPAISGEAEGATDQPTDAEGLSASEESSELRKNKSPHPIKMNRGKEKEGQQDILSPPNVTVSSSTDRIDQLQQNQGLPQSQAPPHSYSASEKHKRRTEEDVTSTEISVHPKSSSPPKTLNISKDTTASTLSSSSSTRSTQKSSPVSDEELLDLLSSAHEDFMSAPFPNEKSKTPSSPSAISPSLPAAQPQVSGLREGVVFEASRDTASSRNTTGSRETTPEASSKKTKQRSVSDSLWQSFSDSKSNRDPLPLALPPQPQMSHSLVAGRVPRQHHHSVSGVYPYPSRPHAYSTRNPNHLWPHIYPHSLPQEPPLLPFPTLPLTPPPHYSMPHPPPPHGPYSPPPHPYSFPPGGAPHPPGSAHQYRHFLDPRHRYRSPVRYRPPFDY